MTAPLPADGAPPDTSSDWSGNEGKPPVASSWIEMGYVRARFGGIPVLITPELAAEIKASREGRS